MKILMFLTDYASYKTYLDLKNYLYNNKCLDNIELDYYYFNYLHANPYNSELQHIFYPDTHLSRYVENDYTDKEYGFVITYTSFMESFMSILKNYVNGEEDLLDIDNKDNLFLNHVAWRDNQYKGLMSKALFNSEIDNIPFADIYLISSRNGFRNFALITVETALALYLIRKHESKVFIGGGAINEANNSIVELINAAGREYTNGKLEYLVGTIGINIFNYLKGYEYQNKRSPIERNVLPITLTRKEFTEYFQNFFVVELVRGCTQGCPYCCNAPINKYDKVDINVYHKWFEYLKQNYPNTNIYFYAPEINTDSDYFDSVLDYLIDNNIKNPLSFYINIIKLKNEQIEKICKLNVVEMNCGLDLLFDNVQYKKYGKLSDLFATIDRLNNILESHNGYFTPYIVANVPQYTLATWDKYKEIYTKYYNYISYSEFVLFPSTVIYKNPSKYGLEYIYYQNRYKELTTISGYINRIPVMYFRNDINRKELVNMKYEILKNMRKYVILGATCGFENESFLKSLVEYVIPDFDLIQKHDNSLDKFIMKFM